jgi:aspartyl-tRNA(Asn)/glutamyl-tRNA(Gln) amidotransferase subunit C
MIDKNQVKHVARLARLALSDEEIEMFTGQLGSILEYADQLNAMDTRDVEPTAFVSPGHDPLRDDEPQPSLSHEDLMRNGPSVKKGYFAVPKVISQ